MATISGALLYDSARTGVASPSMPGIANVPIVLQNLGTNAMLGVNTDANGRYSFTNVPVGDYRIFEAYGYRAGASPGDFSRAATGIAPDAAVPPISYAPNPPPGATRLEAVSPNPLNVAVGAADLTERNFLNAPVTQAAGSADVSVTKEPDLDMATGGERMIYTLTLQNNGPGAAAGVVLKDQVPPEYLNPEYSIDGGDTWQPWTGSFTRGNMDNGATYYVLLRGTVSPTAGDFIMNTATVESSSPDPNAANNTATDRTPITYTADLEVAKSADKSSVMPGEQLTYTLTVKNNSLKEASNVRLTDNISLLLANAEYSKDGGAWLPWSSNIQELGNVAGGATVTYRIRATVSPTAQGRIFNTASVESTTPDPDYRNNRATIQTQVGNTQQVTADVSVTKQADKSTVKAGDQLTYTVNVENRGPGNAGGVTLRDEMPAFISGAEYSVDGSAYSPWTGSAVIGALANGASKTFLIRGRVVEGADGAIQNTASVESATADPEPGNNTSTVETPVEAAAEQPADLSITKQADRTSVKAGQPITYTIEIKNNGPGDAKNAVLTDLVASILDQDEYSPDGGATWLEWHGSYSLGDMSAGSTSSVLLRGRVKQSASGSISNTAAISSSTPDPNAANNRVTARTAVDEPVPAADLAITKQADLSTAKTGQIVTYRITVTNNGPDYAMNVVIRDTLPPQLTGGEVSSDNGATWQAWSGTQTLGTIARGASVVRLIRARVTASTGTIENTASVNGATMDPNTANNNAAARTQIEAPVTPPPPPPPPVEPSADLAVSMRADRASVRVGDTLTYTVAITNNGPGGARDAVLTAAVPPALSGVQFSVGNNSAWQPWPGRLLMGNITNGAAFNIQLRGQVAQSAGGNIISTATVSAATVDTNAANNTASVQTAVETAVSPPKPPPPPPPITPVAPVIPQPAGTPNLEISKTVFPCVARPCCRVAFTLSLSNTGTGNAANVALTDFPANELCHVKYSLDCGASWKPWPGTLQIDVIPAGGALTLILSGIVSQNAICPIFSSTELSYVKSENGTEIQHATCTVPVERCGLFWL